MHFGEHLTTGSASLCIPSCTGSSFRHSNTSSLLLSFSFDPPYPSIVRCSPKCIQKLYHYFISKTLFFEEAPEIRVILVGEVLKYFAKALIIAWFALPSTGGSFTDTLRCKSPSLFCQRFCWASCFSTFSSFALGFAFTNTLIILSDFLS